ncbi:hypothetical protein GCM10009527_047520 [Actinomadura nitritigenes]
MLVPDGRCPWVTVGFADESRTKDLEAGLLGGEPASDLAFSVGVAGFEPTTSSSRSKSGESISVEVNLEPNGAPLTCFNARMGSR